MSISVIKYLLILEIYMKTKQLAKKLKSKMLFLMKYWIVY